MTQVGVLVSFILTIMYSLYLLTNLYLGKFSVLVPLQAFSTYYYWPFYVQLWQQIQAGTATFFAVVSLMSVVISFLGVMISSNIVATPQKREYVYYRIKV